MSLLITDRQQLLDHLRLRAATERPHQLLGDLLVDGGHLAPQNLQQALHLQEQQPDTGRLGQILLQQELIDKQHLAEALVQQLDIARVNLDVFRVEQPALLLLPERLAREQQVLPLMLEGELLVVATPTPSNGDLLHLLGFVTGKQVEAIHARDDEVDAAINLHYGAATALELPEQQGPEPELSLHRIKQLAEDKPTVRFVDSLLDDAISRHASDIHLRPGEREVTVLFRIDGVLMEIRRIKPGNLPAIVSRIKIIGGMNIAERRLPQDGRHLVRLADRTIDLRLSIMPTVHGESVVIRILDTQQSLKTLDQIGFSRADAERFRILSSHSQGILLVTGPTGSGKSTTLYAALNGIKDTGVNIITVEDPVEYQIDGIRQIQVKPQIGYTFARALIQPAVAAQAIEAQAIADGMRPLTQSALALARDTLISLAEVYRVRLE